ncbi:MAG: Gfo/Idh/MocA family oxidoreductase [Nitrospirae bacterium]|nr:Gfo/Idh/MocA family oxidoreductase [Nitrospirota bacterium]
MINVGVIGVGYLGQHHARIYHDLGRESGNIGLAAVVDTDAVRAERIAHNYGCTAYSDYRDILDKVDAVSIVTPTTMHYEIAMECIKAGKDILIEKPVTTTVEEADSLIDAAVKAGLTIQVGHLERFNPVFSEVNRLIDNPIFIETERMSPFLGRGIDVDITLDLMIHDIDIVFAVLNQPPAAGRQPSALIKDIKATGASVLTDNIDIAMAWLEFDSGAQALMKSSRISFEKSRKLKIFQKDSYLLVDYQNMEVKRFYKEGSGDNNEIIQETINVEKKEPLKEELKSFIECVTSKSCPLVSAVEGRNALKIALQIGEKIKK